MVGATMCRAGAVSAHPKSAELAASLQSLQHAVVGLFSTLKDDGATVFEESFASCYPAFWKNS